MNQHQYGGYSSRKFFRNLFLIWKPRLHRIHVTVKWSRDHEDRHMLDRLRTLIGKGAKPSKIEIAFMELPQYIEREELTLRDRLEQEVATRRPQVTTALETIQEILNALSEIERAPSSHPKLEKIAKSSLPHFIRSVQQHIGRPLPLEAEAFYHELSLILKGCITALKGAGKYLPAVFPDEMKALRHEIGIIGRTINELTAIFSQVKQERVQLSSLRAEWSEIQALQTELEKGKDRLTELQAQMQTVEIERQRVDDSLTDLQKSDAYAFLVGQQEQFNYLEREVQDLRLKNEQSLGVFLSVYRRAARIHRHQNNREGERRMEESIALLESSPHNCSDIRENLLETSPLLLEMIRAGTLTLKGQEEQRIAAGPESVSTEVWQSCSDVQAAENRLENQKRMIREMPVQTELLHLKGEESRVLHLHERILQEQEEQKKALQNLPVRLQTLMDELEQKAPEILKNECSILFGTIKGLAETEKNEI